MGAPLNAPPPRISVSSKSAVGYFLSAIAFSPLAGLFLWDAGLSAMVIAAAACALIMLVPGFLAWRKAAEGRALLARVAPRLGMVAEMQVQLYPAGVRVNKSNISGYALHVDIYDPTRGASERRVLQVGRREWITAGTSVLILVDGAQAQVVAFMDSTRGWVARAPFTVAA